jgi:hypothetical protein
MARNPAFEQLLKEMNEIHQKKNEDYSSSGPYENFERSGYIAGWFRSDIDKVFATLVGVKLARLGVLLSTQREPNNESIQDSFLDLTVYCGLWGSYYRSNTNEAASRKESNPLTLEARMKIDILSVLEDFNLNDLQTIYHEIRVMRNARSAAKED